MASRRIEMIAPAGSPMIRPGDDLVSAIRGAMDRQDVALRDGDILVLAQKIVSKSEGRYVDLAQVAPSARARELAAQSGKDPRLVDEERGWGRRDETWRAMQAMAQLGGETWFNLGDQDMALHLRRTELLLSGRSLSEATTELSARLGAGGTIVPMTDDEVRTIIRTADGDLAFQDYFVRRRAEPAAREIVYAGAEKARASRAALAALRDPMLRGVVVAPSNPFLSVAPILAIPEIGAAVRARRGPIMAVSPFVGGKTIKGPAAKLMNELGYPVGADGFLDYYRGVIDALVVDIRDGGAGQGLEAPCFRTDTLMVDAAVRVDLARFCMDVLDQIRRPRDDARRDEAKRPR